MFRLNRLTIGNLSLNYCVGIVCAAKAGRVLPSEQVCNQNRHAFSMLMQTSREEKCKFLWFEIYFRDCVFVISHI